MFGKKNNRLDYHNREIEDLHRKYSFLKKIIKILAKKVPDGQDIIDLIGKY